MAYEQPRKPNAGSGSTQSAGADGETNTVSSERVASRIYGFNGTTWDRLKAGITAVTATLTGFLNVLPWGVYNAVPTTRTEGQGGSLQTQQDGSLWVYMKSLLQGIVAGLENDWILNAPMRRTDGFQDITFDTTHSTSATSIKAATADKRHHITNLTISTTVAATIIIDDADGTVLEKLIFPAAGIFVNSYADMPLQAGINKALRVTSSVAAGTLTVKGRGYTIA